MFRKTRILVVLFISIVAAILYLDNVNYYHGKGYGFIKSTLPFNLKPVHWDWDLGNFGFRIEDKFGLSVIAYGALIESKDESIEVKKIIEYGFNENELVSLIKDKNNNLLYIVLKPSDKIGSKYFKFQIYKKDDFLKQFNKSKFNWIKIEEDSQKIHIYSIVFNYLIVLLVLVLILLLRTLIFNVSCQRLKMIRSRSR